ncbi:MAG TPA: hypothetical protein VMZ74_06110 [Ramlibacter sp.]|nr:hypothetical protein [Ramlibacter sp.]
MKPTPFNDLSAPAKSLFVFAIYLLLLGALLVLAPNFVLGLFRIAPTSEVWIRVVGMLVLVIGTLDALGSIAELQVYIRWTVGVRVAVFVFLCAFAVTGLGPMVLILFGLVDFAGAMWTAWALRRNSQASAPV